MLRLRAASRAANALRQVLAERPLSGAPAAAADGRAGGGGAPPADVSADPFTAKLQRRTEEDLEQVLAAVAKRRAAPAAAAAGEEEEEEAELPPARGDEFGGPRGAEPTRFGDWEHGGRCSDF
jgi:hypothetical protein